MLSVIGLLSVLYLSFVGAEVHQHVHEFYYGTFPKGFAWAAATAAYQIEGAWNADGKGESIWDRFTHTPGHIHEGETGDVACDSYHKYKEDVKTLKDIGVSHYRFSIAWTRLLPDGTLNSVNEKGIAYYNSLINSLIKAGIQPMVTLYHWDLPQALQDMGGFYNSSFVDWYNDYAKLCFQRFGDRVKLWITFNEPWVVAVSGHGEGGMAPGIHEPATGPYRVAHSIIKAHVKAYHTYDREFRAAQNGQLGITLNMEWSEPKTNSTEDVMAAETSMQFLVGWFANTLLGNGDYPDVLKRKIKAKSVGKSRLPEFTAAEIRQNKGSTDFLGVNQYSTKYVSYQPTQSHDVSYDNDQDRRTSTDPKWPTTSLSWLRVVPWGMRRVLDWVRRHYNNPIMYVTENGRSQNLNQTDKLHDDYRKEYLKSYINEILKAIHYEGCNVKGYTVWTLMDNFEWATGYSQKLGLYSVDFNNPALPRTAKDSSRYYAKVIKENGFRNPSVIDPIG